MNNLNFSKTRVVLVLSALVLLFACTGKEETEAGKKYFWTELLPDFAISDEYKRDDPNYLFYRPTDMATDSKGNIYVVDAGNSRVMKYDTKGNFLLEWGKPGVGPGEFAFSVSNDPIFIDSRDNIYISDRHNQRVQIFDTNGKYIGGFKTEKQPNSISVNSKGFVYISVATEDHLDRLVHVYTRDGTLIKKFGKPAMKPKTHLVLSRGVNPIVHDEDDNLYMLFFELPYLRKYSPEGNLIFEKKIEVYKIKNLNNKSDLYWAGVDIQKADESNLFFKSMKYFVDGMDYNPATGTLFMLYPYGIHPLEIDKNGNLLGGYYFPNILLGSDKCVFWNLRINKATGQLMLLSDSEISGAYFFKSKQN